MKKATALIAACFLSLSLFAFSTSLDIDPQGWQNSSRATQENVILQPGMPMLPFIPVRILLPFGEVYQNAELSLSEPQLMANSVDIAIAREQLPISENGLYMYFTDNEKPRQSYKSAQIANNQNQFLPQKSWEFLGTQYYRGYQVALFNVYPYKYNPISKQVLASSSVNITINSSFSTSEAAYQANFVTPNPETRQVIESLVLYPQAINTYNSSFMQYRNVPVTNRTIDLTNPKKMIIITNNQRLPWFSEYANWRSTMGVSTAIYSMEDIVTSYPGSDNAEKVRNFIIHAYQTWATSSEPLQYVILGGDDEIVPERGCYGQVGDTIDLRMPVDMYFSNLDGNWNGNGNLIFGEVADSPDMMPEIHIGRFPAETLAEFQNIFRKTRYYAEQNTFSNNVALFMGENLNWDPVTWGGDYKDDVAQYLPTSYTLDKLYQREGTYSSSAVWNAINNGAGIMNHMGHANEFTLIGQSNGSVESMQNSEYGFLYSQGCYPAAFDQRTSSDGESIGEHLVTASGALFAFIGNSRYGWYMPGD
ncbi:MAG: C25 family cysteine peptidase, partial [Candidatus Cloacimonetes bacterium]|nr:C25 family cysteine peptidase [Candidatus Cloacimonadota bacterium]